MKDFIIDGKIHKLYNSGVRFISGKWFNKELEIKNIKNYIAKACNLFKEDDIKTIMESFIIYFGNEYDKWLELPIVKKAKELGPINDNIQLPFDLDNKQLTIINRLLFHPEDEIMFITTGVGGSGKSTFLNIIKQLFDNDVSATTLDQLSNDFLLTEAVKHRLIASDELAKGELSMAKLKTLISKQRMTCNPKHQASYDVKTQSALFYCCNKPPKIDITDTGILRRIVYYSRDTKIKNPDKTLNSKSYSQDELLIIARRALAFENDDWFELFKKETHINLLKNNSVYLFYLSAKDKSYDEYKNFCYDKNLKPYAEPTFSEVLDLIEEWEDKNEAQIYQGDNIF